jgi:hypothetical protein
MPHHYRPSALVEVGTDPAGSNGVCTAHPGRPLAVKAAGASTSAHGGGLDRALVGTD